MYRFALRPWWIVSHLIVLVIVVVFVNLGLWQLRRLDERREANAQLAERIAEDPVPIEDLADRPPAGIEDRRVTATGTYRPDEAVLIRGRSLDDAPGSWVVVPLDLGDGTVVAVNRGWVRNNGAFDAVPDEYRSVPPGEVTVQGLLHGSQERGTLGASDPEDGTLTSLARVDLDRLDQQVEGDLLPVWLQLTEAEDGAPDPSPTILGLPETDDEGPHLSYAVQWFIFTTIAVGGYPLILRRAARDRGHPDDDDVDDDADLGGPRLDVGAP